MRVAEQATVDARPSTRGERLAAGKDIRSAHRTVKIVRVMFALSAFYSLLMTAKVVAMLSEGDPATWGIVALTTALSALALAGFHLAALQPFVCSLLLASLHTLTVVGELVTGGLPIGRIVVAGLLWLAVVPTVHVKALLRAHPDLFAARRLLGDTSAHGLDYYEQRRRASVRAWRRIGITSAVLLLVVGLASFGAWSHRPAPTPPVDGAVAAFRAAWQAGDPAALAQLCHPESQDHMRGSFERLEQKKGWGSGWPALAEQELRGQSGARVEVWFRLVGGELRTGWTLDEQGTWRLGFLDPPGS
ncbi:MAG: hypothetical protein ABL998_00040 [Planctomycetota bacterium]